MLFSLLLLLSSNVLLGVRQHHCAWLLECLLEFLVSLLLDGLGVLELLDELHLQLLHLHDLVLLLLSDHLFVGHTVLVLSLDVEDFSLPLLLNLHGGEAFLLIDDLVLHPVLLLDLEELVSLLLVVLASNYLGLFRFFSLRQEDGFLNLLLLFLSLLVQSIVVLRLHDGALFLDSIVIDFLKRYSLSN